MKNLKCRAGVKGMFANEQMDLLRAIILLQRRWRELSENSCRRCGNHVGYIPGLNMCDECYHYKYSDVCYCCVYGESHGY